MPDSQTIIGTVNEERLVPDQRSELERWRESRKAGQPAVPEPTPEPVPDEPARPAARVEPLHSPVADPDDAPAVPDQPVQISKRQQYINDLVRKETTAALERDRYKAELEALKAASRGEGPVTRPESDPSDPKPLLANFETLEDHTTAMAEWVYRQHRTKEQAEQAQRAQREAESATTTTYQTRESAFKASRPDFDQVVSQDLPVNAAMIDVIRHETWGPAARYYLGQHPDECARIAALPPGPAYVAMGALQSLVSPPAKAEGVTPPKPQPAVPAPINPVAGGSAVVNKDPSAMNLAEWQAMRRKR